jgi:hypothetical protein
MALVLADRVQEYSTTSGTGTLTLSGAVAGFQTFAAAIGNGNTCYYTITSDANQWEVGVGTVGTNTLARTTLISSSTGSLVSFTGTLVVFVTYPANKAVYGESTTLVAPSGALLPVTNGGTGASTAAGARTALGLGAIATQDANAVAITGGAIDGTTVGSTTVAAGSFSTLNSSGATRLGGLSGNQSLQVNNVASAVNYAQIVGAVTGGTPVFSAQGTDANIGLILTGKGTGVVALGGSTAANSAIQVVPTASSVNFILLYGAVAGSSPSFISNGTDATVGMGISTKSNGNINFTTNSFSNFSFIIKNVASAVNYLVTTGAATTGAPELSSAGSDTNINLKLTPKGTGTLQFGTYTAGIIAQAGYITITDAGGTSRRLLVG